MFCCQIIEVGASVALLRARTAAMLGDNLWRTSLMALFIRDALSTQSLDAESNRLAWPSQCDRSFDNDDLILICAAEISRQSGGSWLFYTRVSMGRVDVCPARLAVGNLVITRLVEFAASKIATLLGHVSRRSVRRDFLAYVNTTSWSNICDQVGTHISCRSHVASQSSSLPASQVPVTEID